jgi:hypothetical protein
MVVVALLSLILLALMTVFNTTQTAFRASVTQTDVQEGGRLAMDLIATDLRAMSPSAGTNFGAVNFSANTSVDYVPSYNEPLVQSLIPGSILRTNVMQDIFILSRANQTWTGVGYVVDFTSTRYVNPLYRFSMSTNIQTDPGQLYRAFLSNSNYDSTTNNWSHLLSGVVHFNVNAYGPNGQWLVGGSSYSNGIAYVPATVGNTGFFMYSNTLPAMVELQLGVLEDRTLAHVEGLGNFTVRSNYLSAQAAKVHLFRQQIYIPNFDPAVYQ